MAGDLRNRWLDRWWPQSLLFTTGLILVVSAIVHGCIFLASADSWDGPVSWRKPTLFGLSFGVTLMAVAWIMSYLPRARRIGPTIAIALAVSSAAEVFLIDMQRWRGVPSHFNFSTPFDSLVFTGGMAGFVGITALAIVAFTMWALLSTDGPPSTVLAIKVGLLLLIVGQGLGGAMVAVGNSHVTTAGSFDLHAAGVFGPNGVIFGAAGVMKLPHGVALHGVQVLLALAWLLTFTLWRDRERLRIIATAVVGYAGLVAVSAYQTFSGLAPLALAGWVSLALWLSIALVGGSFVAATIGLLNSGSRWRTASALA